MRQSPRAKPAIDKRKMTENSRPVVELAPEVSTSDEERFVFDFAQRLKNKEAHSFDFLDELPDRESIQSDAENSWTRMYRAIFNVARRRPELAQELGEMENMISQNPQMLHPAHLIDIASGVMWDPRIHDFLKSTMIHGLGYALRFMESPEYESALTKKLDFSNAEKFSDTAHFLELLQRLYNIGDDYSYDEDDDIVVSRVHSVLADAVSEHKGSYLLNTRAKQLLDMMDDREHIWSDQDRAPFMITRDRYAWQKEDGLYVAGQDETEAIGALIRELEGVERLLTPPQHLVDAALARGESEVMWTPDQGLMQERSAKYSAISNAFTHKLTYDELVQGNNEAAKSQDEKMVDEHDFAYLMQKPVRGIIESDFQINISNLSLQDQYKLLRVLKTVECGKATPLLLETTRALWRLGVKDYLSEIRGGSLEVVSGNSIDSKDVKVMTQIQNTRYEGKYPEEEMKELQEGLANALKSPDSRFYVYRKDGEVLTFVRFDGLVSSDDKEKKHMASFMTNPKFEGGALGQALLEVALQKELEKGPIYAECDPSLVPFYQKYGFVLLRSYSDDHGVDTCDIVLESASESLREAA